MLRHIIPNKQSFSISLHFHAVFSQRTGSRVPYITNDTSTYLEPEFRRACVAKASAASTSFNVIFHPASPGTDAVLGTRSNRSRICCCVRFSNDVLIFGKKIHNPKKLLFFCYAQTTVNNNRKYWHEYLFYGNNFTLARDFNFILFKNLSAYDTFILVFSFIKWRTHSLGRYNFMKIA